MSGLTEIQIINNLPLHGSAKRRTDGEWFRQVGDDPNDLYLSKLLDDDLTKPLTDAEWERVQQAGREAIRETIRFLSSPPLPDPVAKGIDTLLRYYETK